MLVHVSASDKPRLDRAGQLLKLCFPKFPASFWPRHVQSSNTVLYVADDTLADAIGGDADASKAVMNPILLEQHISEPTILDDAPATSDDEEDESEESGSDEESDDEAESGDSKAGDSGSESSHSTAAGPAVDEAQVLGVITWRSVELGSPSLAGFFQDLLALDVGAASLPPSQRSKVMHIQFVGVLSAARRGRIGTRLIEAVLAHARLECCCAVVVHSEPSAVPFFSRAGFTDEPRLNIRYKSLTSVLARSTLMSFSLLGTTSPLVPAASPGHVHGDFTSDVALLTQRFLASQATAMADSLWLIQALRTEVEMLRGQLASKADETSTLKMQINRLTQQNAQLQRIVTLSSSTAVSEPRGDTDPSSPLLSVPNGSTEFVSVAASVEVSALSSSRDATVTHVWKPMESDATLAFAAAVRRITADWTTALTIAANGFTADTRPALSPGSGWVLSRRLEMNRPTSEDDCVLVIDTCVGRVESLASLPDCSSPGYHSVVLAGPSGTEFVVFDGSQLQLKYVVKCSISK